MNPVERVFRDFAGLFDRLQIPYAVMGGLAVRAHAIPRPTYDVDVTVLRKIVRLLTESRNHVLDVVDLLAAAGSSGGNLVVDAQITALAIAHNATVHTADRDFMRFKGLKCHYPLDADA